MHAPVPREKLERLARLLAEQKRRRAKKEQAQRGWYDDDGVRQGGLIAFVRYYWHILEPETDLVDGWPLWAMCEHLEAVTFGEVTRLLMNVPPGFMKSLLVDVFWPAWEWGPMGKAHLRYVTFSYSASLTERDNRRFGDLVSSKEYRELWCESVRLVKLGETLVSNTRKGWKLASSVGGVGTGERGNRVILDDPNNVKEAESEPVRNETNRWFRESMSNRLNDLEADAIIIITQRVHADDVSGTIITLQLPYCHLCIPMEYDSSRQVVEEPEGSGIYVPVETQIGWIDPRYDPDAPHESDGDLAWDDRFPERVVATTKKEIGPFAWAGQYQQTPAPRGGGLFKNAWWQVWDSPDGKFPIVEFVLASLDGAFTEKETNSPSALTVWGVFKEKESGQRRIILLHAWRKFLEFSGPRIDRLPTELTPHGMDPHVARARDEAYRRRTMPEWGLIEWVADTCNRFKVDKLLIEAKASGISAGQELRNRYEMRNWAIDLQPVTGDKYARALAVQPTFSQLMIYAPVREWSEMVIEEMEAFPKHKFKDLTDSTSQAIKWFRDNGLAQTDDEARAEEAERATHRPRSKPLYPV